MRVIHIMSHFPAYDEFANQSHPAINWDTPDGSWVGIWGYDWADLLAIESRKINQSIDHEIWQPDQRAEKVYSREIFPGVVHRLFPAEVNKVRFGFKWIDCVDFSNMISELKRKEWRDQVIVQIGNFQLLRHLLESGCAQKIVFSFMGDIMLPAQRLFTVTKNLPAKISLLKEHRDFKKSVKAISALSYMNDNNCDMLKRYYSGPLEKITMGTNFDYWRKLDKKSCRQDLQLPTQRKILFSSSRLNEMKQVDRFIHILKRLCKKHDFLFVVSGHGTRQYEEYLRSLAKPLLEQNKIEFVGYIPEDKLLMYYCACDLFVLTSLSEGASVSVIKALACETAVFTTDVGNTAEVLREHDSGIIVSKRDYKSWEYQLDLFFSGDPVVRLPVAIARECYHWPNIAKKFNDIYKSVV